jgi:MYXO-CTERM domain-containing protein
VAALVAALALAPASARAAAVLDNFRQGSHAGTSGLSIGFVVGSGADRLLLVGVSTARSDVAVTGVSWRGVAGTHILALPINQGSRDCRTELWQVLDPPSGLGQVAVTLSSTAAMGMGMVSYSGVDQQSPTSVAATATGSASPVRVPVSVPSARPVLGLACLGGTWNMLNGPDAIASPGDTNLWDFTEQNVVGLGNHQAFPGSGALAISWNVTFADPFAWGAIGLSITPAGLAPPPPDAGPDLAPDLGPDLGPDLRVAEDAVGPDALTPPAEDGGADRESEPPDAATTPADAELEPDAPPPVEPPDVSSPHDPDGGDIARDVNLRVGCACRLDGRGSSAPVLVGALGLLALFIRRRLI